MLFITDRIPNFVGDGTIEMSSTDVLTVTQALSSGFISLIENPEVCYVTSSLLGITVPTQSLNVAPKIGEDTVILVNVIGAPLPKGATQLPAGNSVQFSIVESRKPAITLTQVKRSIGAWLLR